MVSRQGLAAEAGKPTVSNSADLLIPAGKQQGPRRLFRKICFFAVLAAMKANTQELGQTRRIHFG
jgi:hypothetical protein